MSYFFLTLHNIVYYKTEIVTDVANRQDYGEGMREG